MCDRSTTCTAIYGTHRMRTYISYQPPTNASLAGNLIAHCSQLSFISLLNREPHILPWVRGAGGSFEGGLGQFSGVGSGGDIFKFCILSWKPKVHLILSFRHDHQFDQQRFSSCGHAATFCIFINSSRAGSNKASAALITIVISRNLWASGEKQSITFLQTRKSPSFVTTLSKHGHCLFLLKHLMSLCTRGEDSCLWLNPCGLTLDQLC